MLIEIAHIEQVEVQDLHQHTIAPLGLVHLEARLHHEVLPIEVLEQELVIAVLIEAQHLEQVPLDHLEQVEVALVAVLTEVQEAPQEARELTEARVVQADLLQVQALDHLDQAQDRRRRQVVETKSKIISNLL